MATLDCGLSVSGGRHCAHKHQAWLYPELCREQEASSQSKRTACAPSKEGASGSKFPPADCKVRVEQRATPVKSEAPEFKSSVSLGPFWKKSVFSRTPRFTYFISRCIFSKQSHPTVTSPPQLKRPFSTHRGALAGFKGWFCSVTKHPWASCLPVKRG